MDPHMNPDDLDGYHDYEQQHRCLQQRLAPPSPATKGKKKRLVNFKVSRRLRSVRKIDKDRRESCSSGGSIYTSCDIPLKEIKDGDKKREDGKISTGRKERRNSDEINYNRSPEEDDRYFNETRGDFRSLGNQKRDNRSVKERREDFKRIHEKRSNTKLVTERRGGILHINEGHHETTGNPDEDTGVIGSPLGIRPATDRNGNPIIEKNSNPVTGKNGNPITGKNGNPVTGKNGNPVTGKNGNPVTGNTHRRKSDPKDLDFSLAPMSDAGRRGSLERIGISSVGHPHRRTSDPKDLEVPSRRGTLEKTDNSSVGHPHRRISDPKDLEVPSRRGTLEKTDNSSVGHPHRRISDPKDLNTRFPNDASRRGSLEMTGTSINHQIRRISDPKDLNIPRPPLNNENRRGTLEKIGSPPSENPYRRKAEPKASNIPPKNTTNTTNRKAAVTTKTDTSKSAPKTAPNTQRRRPGMPQRSHSTSSWDRVRGATGMEGLTSRMSTVVEMVTCRRRTSLAPTIWTPAVPRSPPAPRPANFSDQEEPGNRMFTISFLTRPPKCRHRSNTLRNRRPQPSLLYRTPTAHWETSGKQYMAWLRDLVDNPLLQDGNLLLGLEIGVQFSAVHLREVFPDAAASGGERRQLEGSLGADCILSQGVFEEVVSWIPELLVTCPSDPSQWARCYIMLGFMTIEGELDKKMETLWKEWTGALYVYCNVDDELGLKKLTFYRRHSEHQANLFSYLVLIELDTVTQKNCLTLLDFVYRMRLRNMSGYISVYQSHCPDSGLTMVPGGSPVSLRARSPINTSSTDSYVEKTSHEFDRLGL